MRLSSLVIQVYYFFPVIFALFELVPHPQLNYQLFGNQLGLLGKFSSLSFYNYLNASQLSNQPNTVFATNNSINASLPIFELNGPIDQLLPLTSETFLILGNFSLFNNQSINSPFIYNITDNSIDEIISTFNKRNSVPINGTITTAYVDSDLIYFGGDFEFNSSFGAAIYNYSSQIFSTLPFRGFGKNSSINSISRIFADNNQGSLIFGGKFDTLGFKELLVHNVTTNGTNNTSNLTSLITAEQQISLKHGIFSSINTYTGDPKSLICPRDNAYWSVNPGQGGEWTVELPDEMKGLTPSKARLYIPDSTNSIKTFRIYTFPNNGIMNLSYIDPNTNEMAHCDAWCPLLTVDELQKIAMNNMNNKSASNNETFYIDENGSFISYYNSSTRVRTLGYGSSFQEFSFVNQIPIDKVGLTVISWYGDQGASAGFELYTDSIKVYGNNTLNEPNCQDENDLSTNNLADIIEGNWNSITVLDPSFSGTNYLVSNDTNAKIVLYPNISYSGIYSMIITTPGCIPDNTCDSRSIVNVTVIDGEENVLATQLIYQNNNYNKFDYLFYGHLNGSISDTNKVRVEISHLESINKNSETSLTVVDKIIANIIELDDYLDINSTNSTNSTNYKLEYISLNGLFEYSLDNFTNFNETKVIYTEGNSTRINPENNYIGNSSINLLSGSLSSDSYVEQIQLVENEQDEKLLILGNFDIKHNEFSISNNNLITLNVTSYNRTSNETVTSLLKRGTELSKRSDSISLYGATFSNPIDKIYQYGSQIIFLGNFTVSGANSTILKDLSNKNQSVDTINNIAIYSNDNWYGLGNNNSISFTKFTNITIDGNDLSVYSSDTQFMTWDNDNLEWSTDPRLQLKINSAINLSDMQQVIVGESFKISDYYGTDQAFSRDGVFSSYSINVTENSFGIETSHYINNSVSVIGGNFNISSSISNVCFVYNGSTNVLPLISGNSSWREDNSIQTLYSSSDQETLYIGMNGSLTIRDNNYTGVIIYDLVGNNFKQIQPPRLSNDDGSGISVNAIVQYDDGGKLLVGGDFDQAGSFDCNGLCIYDLNNTRWINPAANSTGNLVSGIANDIRFFSSNQVLISGNLTLNNEQVNFVYYDFDTGTFDTNSKLNSLGSNKIVNKFIIQEPSIVSPMVAYGDNFIAGFDGNNWNNIGQEIRFNEDTQLNDIKLLDLKTVNNANNGTYFKNNQILALAGKFELVNFGLVNVAFYNGSNWIPYIFSVDTNNEIGQINSLLINDRFNFLSSQNTVSRSVLARGKVVGISLACALGSTTFLGLLYLIPYILLFKKERDGNQYQHERIDEKDQLDAVNPEELLYEMDLQRNH